MPTTTPLQVWPIILVPHLRISRAAIKMSNVTLNEYHLLSLKIEELRDSVNASFLVCLAIIIFLMQGGFAFLEAGSVRTKNTVNILIKNMLDCLLGGVAYGVLGWGIAFGGGGNPVIGMSNFCL